jgi:hypothetical protein
MPATTSTSTIRIGTQKAVPNERGDAFWGPGFFGESGGGAERTGVDGTSDIVSSIHFEFHHQLIKTGYFEIKFRQQS